MFMSGQSISGVGRIGKIDKLRMVSGLKSFPSSQELLWIIRQEELNDNHLVQHIHMNEVSHSTDAWAQFSVGRPTGPLPTTRAT